LFAAIQYKNDLVGFTSQEHGTIGGAVSDGGQGGQNDFAQMFRLIVQQLMQGQG
jgi:hypothetical protein